MDRILKSIFNREIVRELPHNMGAYLFLRMREMEASVRVDGRWPTLKESLYNVTNIGDREDLNALEL